MNALDLNTGEYEESARVEYPVAGDITTAVLTAPEVQDEVFSQWDLKDTGITLAEGYKLTDKTIKVNLPETRPAVLELDAQFIPVISQIDVHLSKPAGGEPMQTEAKERTGAYHLRYSHHGEISERHLRHYRLPGAGDVALTSAGRLHPWRERCAA